MEDKKKKKVNIPLIVFFVVISYLLYLLGSCFLDYGKEDKLFITVVQEKEDNMIERYSLYTSGKISKTDTTKTSELGLTELMGLKLYSNIVYRLALEINETDKEQKIVVYNSSGNIIKEYVGSKNILNKVITDKIVVDLTDTRLELVGN